MPTRDIGNDMAGNVWGEEASSVDEPLAASGHSSPLMSIRLYSYIKAVVLLPGFRRRIRPQS